MCFGFLFGLCFGVCCLVCVCLLLTLSRSSKFDQRLAENDRHSCHGAHGIGSKKGRKGGENMREETNLPKDGAGR